MEAGSVKVTINIERGNRLDMDAPFSKAKIDLSTDEPSYRSGNITQGLVDTTGKAVERIIQSMK